MATLTPGKARGLSQTSSASGVFSILALDHRDSMRVVLDPEAPESIEPSRLTSVKMELLQALGPETTAVMLDPEYSVAQSIVSRVLPGTVGFLAALEAQGYLGDPSARTTSVLPGWSVEKAKRVGSSGIKLLVLYRPDISAADVQDELIASVVEDCAAHDIPLFLEPLLYATDPDAPVGSREFAAIRPELVIESARRLGALRPDVLKVQFPVDTAVDDDEAAWSDACRRLDDVSPVPWALLSGGDPFELFTRQVEVACRSGASGFMVGRALWREAVVASEDQRATIIETVVAPRFEQLAALAERHAKPWWDVHVGQAVDHRWFESY